MKEDRMQFECVDWFRSDYPEHARALILRHNEIKNASHYLALGMVYGASDLDYTTPNGNAVFLELKVEGATHPRIKLERQLRFLDMMADRNCLAFFVFSLDHFKRIMTELHCKSSYHIDLAVEASKSRNFIRELLKKKNKQIKIPNYE